MAPKKHQRNQELQEIQRIFFQMKVSIIISMTTNIFEQSLAPNYALVLKLKIMLP